MDSEVANVVEAILTAILQWRVSWLDEQKKYSHPPPICRTSPKKLKITYDCYKDYESTFVPLLMHEIWAQIFEEWTKLESELSGTTPMDVDDAISTGSSILTPTPFGRFGRGKQDSFQGFNTTPRQFYIGVTDYRSEGQYQCKLKCQFIVDTNNLFSQLKLIGEGDMVRLDLVLMDDQKSQQVIDCEPTIKKSNILSLFAYIVDVQPERITHYTTLAECFSSRPKGRNQHVVNYYALIAKRPLRLKLSEPMKMSGIYYLKPMIRQIESVAILRESALASDILSPKQITCQLSTPTIVSINSPHYNDMQYKAIIGANEALNRNIPKIQLIQGPPGTGKTHTLIGIIKHFYLNWSDPSRVPKILICAPSNGAIDEVARRLYKEREFLKTGPLKRSLRMVRVGHPDQVSENIKCISLEELVETNANKKIDDARKKHLAQVKELENELSRCDTELTNLRFTNRHIDIPVVESKMGRLLKQLQATKDSEEVTTRREVSEAAKRKMRYELIKNTDVVLTTLNSCQRYPLDVMFKGQRAEYSFQCVIVDEASQCCEPELLMPLCYRISRMILIGDPMQLPATVISRHAQEFDFGRSLFERFFIYFGKYEQTSPIAMLTHQYRMHPDICSFPSKQFYDNRLVSARQITSVYPIKPYIMFDLRHSSETKSNRTSIENEVEATFVRTLLMAVLRKAPENSKIGVITPYRGQKRLITNKIESLKSQRNITVDVNTCDGFQGQEKDIIILSCVRATELGAGSIGFLRSYQRVNVALTRAKHSLIICISTKSLSKDATWKAMIDDSSDRGCTQVLTHTPSSDLLVEMISLANDPYLNMPAGNSKLVRTNGSGFVDGCYEPEFVMPMDID